MSANFIASVLAHSVPDTSSGAVSLHWNGLSIGRHLIGRDEKPRQEIDQHVLMLWEKTTAIGEIEIVPGRFETYEKSPGTITTLIPGLRPAIRPKREQPVLVCTIPPRFLHDLELEADRRPKGPFQALHGTEDRPLQDLMMRLSGRSLAQATGEEMRRESLFIELGTRLLFASRVGSKAVVPAGSGFPRHLLRRVLEKIHDEFESDLSLSDLAAQSGYSRAHFMRIFKATMGTTPHSYLLEIRLMHAQRLLASASSSVIDLALRCGLHSNAHFTAAFSRRFGVPPSMYRKFL